MRSTPILIAFTLLALPLVGSFSTVAQAPTSCRPGDVFENENVRIWFHGSKGFVKVFDNNASDDSQGHFDLKTGELVETDGDGAQLARMDLERAFPQTSGCAIEETPEWVNMTLTVTDDVRGAGGSLGQATVEFAYHFNKSSNGAKFDLNVFDWPWQGEGELSYVFDVHAAGGTLTDAENGIGYADENGQPRGFMEWAANATTEYADGHSEVAIVDSSTDSDGQTARVTLRFTNTTAGYDALLYDPWMGAGTWIVVGPLLIGVPRVEDLILQTLGLTL